MRNRLVSSEPFCKAELWSSTSSPGTQCTVPSLTLRPQAMKELTCFRALCDSMGCTALCGRKRDRTSQVCQSNSGCLWV